MKRVGYKNVTQNSTDPWQHFGSTVKLKTTNVHRHIQYSIFDSFKQSFFPQVKTLTGGGCSTPTRPWSSPCRVNPMIRGPISRCKAQGTQCKDLESPATKEGQIFPQPRHVSHCQDFTECITISKVHST